MLDEDTERTILVKGGQVNGPVRRPSRESAHILLEALYSLREKYRLPWFQRGRVWTNEESSYFLRSISWNFPVDSILTIRRYDEQEQEYLDIIDGQQSFTSIMMFFKNMIRTPTVDIATKFNPGSPVPVREPNLYYDNRDSKGQSRNSISPALRSDFNNYRIEVVTMNKVPVEWETAIFRDRQLGRALTLGQNIYANLSRAARIARELEGHMAWRDLYKISRKFTEDLDRLKFMCALQMIAIETTEKPYLVVLNRREMARWAAGIYDHRIDDGLEVRLSRRLDGLGRVLKGVDAVGRTDAILFGQLARHLEDSYGYSLEYSDESCLTGWYRRIRAENNLKNVTYNLMIKSTYMHNQQVFWEEQLPYVLHQIPGLCKREEMTEERIAELATAGRL